MLVGTLLLAPVVPAAAAVTLDVNTTYGGVEADSQAIDATVSLAPEGNAIVDATITIRETTAGFVDQESFSTTVDPASADAGATYEGAGRYTIEELEPGESITISFTAYPRTVKAESLDVAVVDIEYVQEGQDLTEQTTVTADLSNSSYFALQDAQDRVAQLESALQQRQWLTYAAGLVIALGVLAVLYRLFEGRMGGFGGNGGDGGGGSRFE